MKARRKAGRLLVGVVVTLLVGGCATSAIPTPLPASPTPTGVPSAAVATPTPTPATSATAAAVSFGPVTVVTGTAICPGLDITSFDWTTDPDGTRHVRDDYHANRCIVTTDDPRVSGHRSSTWNIDLWGDIHNSSAALVQWGTAHLENAGGAWEGRATGVGSWRWGGDIIVNWYTGTGGYAGLAYFELWTGSGPWKIEGQIFPGDPPLPYAERGAPDARPEAGGPVAGDAVAVVEGTGTCPTVDLGDSTTDAEGVTHYRGGTFRCAMTTDDPRVSGTHTTATWNADWWGADLSSGALVQWATVRLENDGGAWDGQLTGVYSSDRGDTIVIWYKGTGGYAGLSYFELWTGSDPWKIQGQVFPGDPPTP